MRGEVRLGVSSGGKSTHGRVDAKVHVGVHVRVNLRSDVKEWTRGSIDEEVGARVNVKSKCNRADANL